MDTDKSQLKWMYDARKGKLSKTEKIIVSLYLYADLDTGGLSKVVRHPDTGQRVPAPIMQNWLERALHKLW